MAKNFKVEWNDKQAKDAAKKTQGLQTAGQFLLDEAHKLVPLDEGVLMNSGNVMVDKETMTAAVYFDTSYAVRQHEDLTLRHKNGRKAKYLETPFKQHQLKLQQIIAGKIKIGDK